MNGINARLGAISLAALLGAACAGGPGKPGEIEPIGVRGGGLTPAQQVGADQGIPPYTDADVEFLSGMIPHHAQAVLMAGWASSHGAGASVRGLSERIVVAQRDEIAFMQRWLRVRGKPVPDGMASSHTHSPLMPGMLNAEQVAQLDEARGPEFDRLFLTFMIRHHRGAITMVGRLMGSHGAAQDDDVFKFAADVNADQATEVDRMTLMLTSLGPDRPSGSSENRASSPSIPLTTTGDRS